MGFACGHAFEFLVVVRAKSDVRVRQPEGSRGLLGLGPRLNGAVGENHQRAEGPRDCGARLDRRGRAEGDPDRTNVTGLAFLGLARHWPCEGSGAGNVNGLSPRRASRPQGETMAGGAFAPQKTQKSNVFCINDHARNRVGQHANRRRATASGDRTAGNGVVCWAGIVDQRVAVEEPWLGEVAVPHVMGAELNVYQIRRCRPEREVAQGNGLGVAFL